jgi:hypothetical protein
VSVYVCVCVRRREHKCQGCAALQGRGRRATRAPLSASRKSRVEACGGTAPSTLCNMEARRGTSPSVRSNTTLKQKTRRGEAMQPLFRGLGVLRAFISKL